MEHKNIQYIKENADRLTLEDWKDICSNYNEYDLNEEIIRDYADDINWKEISKYAILSEDFIRTFQDKVVWKYLDRCQKLSYEFKDEFQERLYNSMNTNQLIAEEIARDKIGSKKITGMFFKN